MENIFIFLTSVIGIIVLIFLFILCSNVAKIRRNLEIMNYRYKTEKKQDITLGEGKSWDCPKCNVNNENTTFKCKNCGYELT